MRDSEKRKAVVARASRKHYAKLKADPVAYRAFLDAHNRRRRERRKAAAAGQEARDA